MNLIVALLLQAAGMGKDPTAHPPGREGGFSKIVIVIFIVVMTVAAGVALWMTLRGAAGATKEKVEKEEGK